jgi:predicted esterase
MMSIATRLLLVGSLLCLPPISSAQVNPFTWYDKGFVPYHASQADPRFPYMLYVPEDYDEHSPKLYPLIVLVHGTERWPHYYLEQNAEFAEEHDVILLAPLFPIGTHGGQDLENYKLVEFKGTRYDLILLSMVDEVASKYKIEANEFSMFGFSGGGHFAHRFFYLHPHRLKAVSIGAPGMVTLIDDERDWWVGTRDVYWKFNVKLNLEKMADVAVHMVVGSEDTESWGDEIEKESVYYMGDAPGATYNSAGGNRQERLKTLKENFEEHGIDVILETVEGAGHDETYMFPSMQKFFIEAIPLRK